MSGTNQIGFAIAALAIALILGFARLIFGIRRTSVDSAIFMGISFFGFAIAASMLGFEPTLLYAAIGAASLSSLYYFWLIGGHVEAEEDEQ